MKTRSKGLIILTILMLICLLTAGLSSLRVNAANQSITGDILQPIDNKYEYIGEPSSICSGGGNIYIADSLNNKIYVYNETTLAKQSELKLEVEPKKLRIRGNVLYLLDKNKDLRTFTTASENNTILAQNVLDFDLVGEKLIYAKTENYNTMCYITDYTQTPTKTDNFVLTEATPLEFYLTYLNNKVYYCADGNIRSSDGNSDITVYKNKFPISLTSNGAKLYIATRSNVEESTGIENDTPTILQTANLSESGIKNIFTSSSRNYIIDRNYNAILVYDNSWNYIGNIAYSFNEAGRLYKPIDVAERDGKIYILDDNAITTISGGTILSTINISETNIKNMRALTVDDNGTIYLLTDKIIYSYTSSGEQKQYTNSKFTNLRDITYCIDGNIYALEKTLKQIYKLTPTGAFEAFANNVTAKRITTNLKTKRVYSLNDDNSITAYNTLTGESKSISSGVTESIDIQADFSDNIYTLSKSASSYNLTKLNVDNGYNKEYTKTLTAGITPLDIRAFTIDNTSGNIIAIDSRLNYALSYTKSSTNTNVSTDIPIIVPSIVALNRTYGNMIQVGIIKGFPSTLLYPVHSSLSEKNYYPTGNTGTEVISVEKQTEVIILETVTKNSDKFLYVICNGIVGFVYSDAVEIKELNYATPYNVQPMHSTADIYSYPSTKTISLKNSYGIYGNNEQVKLNYDNTATVLAEFSVKENGSITAWYLTSFNNKKCFVQKNQMQVITTSNNVLGFKYARISTGINTGLAKVHTGLDFESKITGELRDNARIKVYYEDEDFAYVRLEDSKGNTVLQGYIDKDYLLYNGLTTTQTTILILVVALVLLTVTTVVAIKVFKR